MWNNSKSNIRLNTMNQTLKNIVTTIKDFFQPSVASITSDFAKATAKLDALANKLEEEMDAHQLAIEKHIACISAKATEVDACDAISANIRNLLNIKE